MADRERDLAAFGVITETGTFLSTEFPLDRNLEHRVRTGQMKVAERDSDGSFRSCNTVLVVRERGKLVPFDREAHTAQMRHDGSVVPQEWYEEEHGGVEDQGGTVEEAPVRKSGTRRKKKAAQEEQLEDQGGE